MVAVPHAGRRQGSARPNIFGRYFFDQYLTSNLDGAGPARGAGRRQSEFDGYLTSIRPVFDRYLTTCLAGQVAVLTLLYSLAGLGIATRSLTVFDQYLTSI